MYVIETIKKWYGKFERPISSFSLIFGFVFDAFTLRRVDALWDNIWVLGHILIVGTFIVLIHANKATDGDEKNPEKAQFWYVNILQFFFGGILSTYLVFYFRSADILVTWPFILILAIAFMANESLKRHYTRLTFQISLFFLSLYSFAIFIIPVILHKIGPEVFIFSGVLSFVLILMFNSVLFYFSREKFRQKRKLIWAHMLGILLVVNLLYFSNLIPPIPLSLKDGGIYNSVQKNPDGNYIVEYEDLGFKGYFELYPDFKEVPGASVYAFSAIFSPSNLNLTIVHDWQYYDQGQKKWLSKNKVELPVIGGRDGGFRTFSVMSNPAAGKWRVNIETQEGQLIGRLRVTIVSVNTKPVLSTDIK